MKGCKPCITCKEIKPLEKFHKCWKSESRRSECKDCAKERNKELYQNKNLKIQQLELSVSQRTHEILEEIEKTRAYLEEKGEEEKAHALMLCKLQLIRKFAI